jgi:CII-binding regulator of phage lambda lysogenization HflD
MIHNKYDQTLALAGIYQTASLVKQIANRGQANSAQIESSLETLFRFDANGRCQHTFRLITSLKPLVSSDYFVVSHSLG